MAKSPYPCIRRWKRRRPITDRKLPRGWTDEAKGKAHIKRYHPAFRHGVQPVFHRRHPRAAVAAIRIINADPLFPVRGGLVHAETAVVLFLSFEGFIALCCMLFFVQNNRPYQSQLINVTTRGRFAMYSMNTLRSAKRSAFCSSA